MLCLTNLFKTMEATFCNMPINSVQKGVLWNSSDVVNWMNTSPTAASWWQDMHPPALSIPYWSQIRKSRAGLLNSKENLIENQIEEEFFFRIKRFTVKCLSYSECAW
jgi:hypothetical protein